MNHCAKMVYAEKVLGHIDLPGEWAGWRLRGKWLVSPDGERINPLRLRGILFREAGEKRLAKSEAAKAVTGGKVVAFRNGARQKMVGGHEPTTED